MTQQFYVSGIFETIGSKCGVNIGCDGMDDDMCYGIVISSQATVTQLLNKHKGIYNFLILDDIIDGIPIIRLIKRAVGDDLEVDAIINQADCIPPDDKTPAIQFTRVDPMSLPRSVELQYISFDRNFAINTQYAHNEGAKTQQAIMSVQSDFILTDAVARKLAYDLLYRMWQQQLTISFEHRDLTLEPGDVVQIQTDAGVYVIQILTSMITKEPNDSSGSGRTNLLSGQLLLTRRGGTTITPGQVNTSSSIGVFHLYTSPTLTFVGGSS